MRAAAQVRSGLLDIAGRAAILGGAACALLITRSPWWTIGAVALIPLGVWLTVARVRARRNAVADEALEAAAEFDRAHPAEQPDPKD